MPRFSANLSMLYSELDFPDRFAAAADDGFKGVEYVGAYGQDPDQLRALLDRHGLEQVLFNLPAGDWAGGERGIACLPDRIDDFRRGVALAIVYSQATGCSRVNCLAGIAPPDMPRERLEQVLADNLRYCAEQFAAVGIRLLLEPINPRDIPGFLVNSTGDFERIAEAVGHDNLYLQYDFYHRQVVEGDLLAGFAGLQKRIAHVQVADNPGRHEPGTGEIAYANIFAALDAAGYEGWVGAEYKPRAGTSAGLGWFALWRHVT